MTRRRKPDKKPADSGRRVTLLLASALPFLIAVFVLMLLVARPRTPGQELRLDEWLSLARDGQVRDAEILVEDARITGTYSGGTYWTAFPDREAGFSAVMGAIQNAGIPARVNSQWNKSLIGPATILLPALIFVDAILLLYMLTRTGGIGSFTQARTRDVERRTTFADVAGVKEAEDELRDIKDYLEDPERFVSMGATIPRGVLLTGPPGCGKTLLARALAGEAGVPFYSLSGSDFVELFVGVGASRIRDLFRRARQNAPAIVFIDELDAVGRLRQTVAIGGQDEREATLNQLLVEMDGFDPSLGVVVLAATNRLDILDSALLRPGRFDRRVVMDRPDMRGRLEILEVHARGKPLAASVDLAVVARRTPGFSGADLANVLNEAAILATRDRVPEIAMKHLDEAVDRSLAGGARRSRLIGERERRVIAAHEAGHAVVAAALPDADAPTKVSIVSRGAVLGFTVVQPLEDRVLATEAQLGARMISLLAGRAAEALVFQEVSTQAEDDLVQVTRLAESMVRSLGMSKLGAMVLDRPDDGLSLSGALHSESLSAEADAEMRRIVARAEEDAAGILSFNRKVLDAVAARLVAAETIEGDELRKLLASVEMPGSKGPPVTAAG